MRRSPPLRSFRVAPRARTTLRGRPGRSNRLIHESSGPHRPRVHHFSPVVDIVWTPVASSEAPQHDAVRGRGAAPRERGEYGSRVEREVAGDRTVGEVEGGPISDGVEQDEHDTRDPGVVARRLQGCSRGRRYLEWCYPTCERDPTTRGARIQREGRALGRCDSPAWPDRADECSATAGSGGWGAAKGSGGRSAPGHSRANEALTRRGRTSRPWVASPLPRCAARSSGRHGSTRRTRSGTQARRPTRPPAAAS